ncbi:MAG TPA: GNAT family N-acetyltransferase [Acidobacteriota bacterium]|nr:GNAT family N-acetyltransferase [Acidobacteriota bacterium]
MPQEIEHQEDRRRFILALDGDPAALEYDRIDERRVDFKSTYVPKEERRRGIGGRLVRRGLEWARRNDLKVIPSCPFVKSFVDDHPEFKDVVD